MFQSMYMILDIYHKTNRAGQISFSNGGSIFEILLKIWSGYAQAGGIVYFCHEQSEEHYCQKRSSDSKIRGDKKSFILLYFFRTTVGLIDVGTSKWKFS